MSRVEAATGPDRLPWLPDEPKATKARRRGGGAIVSMAVAALLVGGAAFWLGTREIGRQVQPAPVAQKTATVRLPEARPAGPAQPQVELATPPEVEPVVAPPTPVIEQPRVARRAPSHRAADPPKADEAPKAAKPAGSSR